jgi:ectoine hydroxylase-related dioxygenase (phytanoyl-CoA dioxygenase family)
MTTTGRYGVKLETSAKDHLDVLAEEISLLGYTTLSAAYSDAELDRFSDLFQQAAKGYARKAQQHGYDLDAMKERDVLRMLPVAEPEFWKIVFHDQLQRLIGRLLGSYFILNQVNGLTNRGNNQAYHQAQYHRDLPYQHFTSSRPLAINALFALDDFTLENGATRVLPATQHQEAFPSAEVVSRIEKQITVKRGTFLVLDCMLYHAGGVNRSPADRRAINHVFTVPILRQQFHFPSVLGKDASAFTTSQKQVLGYGLEEFRGLEDWFDARNNGRG